jgi:hypothetical protein
MVHFRRLQGLALTRKPTISPQANSGLPNSGASSPLLGATSHLAHLPSVCGQRSSSIVILRELACWIFYSTRIKNQCVSFHAGRNRKHNVKYDLVWPNLFYRGCLRPRRTLSIHSNMILPAGHFWEKL